MARVNDYLKSVAGPIRMGGDRIFRERENFPRNRMEIEIINSSVESSLVSLAR